MRQSQHGACSFKQVKAMRDTNGVPLSDQRTNATDREGETSASAFAEGAFHGFRGLASGFHRTRAFRGTKVLALARHKLSNGLSSLAHGVLGKLSGKIEALMSLVNSGRCLEPVDTYNCSLNLASGDSGLLVLFTKEHGLDRSQHKMEVPWSCLIDHALKDVVYIVVHDHHCVLRDAGIGVDLLQHLTIGSSQAGKGGGNGRPTYLEDIDGELRPALLLGSCLSTARHGGRRDTANWRNGEPSRVFPERVESVAPGRRWRLGGRWIGSGPRGTMGECAWQCASRGRMTVLHQQTINQQLHVVVLLLFT